MNRASEERQLALLVASAADYAIFMMDPAGVVLTWNAGAERMKGYTRDEIVGRHFSTFYTPEDKERDHPGDELRWAMRDGRYEEEGWRVRKDGSRFWANIVITPLYDESGAHVGFGKVSRDLTVRRLAEEQARARTLELETANGELAEFRRLVSSVRDYAIFMLDPAGHIMSWNAGARRLKGYEPDEIIGRHFSTFYTADDKARDHPANELAIAVREGRYEEEGWRVKKDGSTFWASVTITAVRDEEGRLTGFAKVTRDLTERKRAEDELQQAVEDLRRANAELDRFASIAAHDMADPLRTISGFAEMLMLGGLPAEEIQEFAGNIFASSSRLSEMLQGLLTYARAGRVTEPSRPIDLAEATRAVLDDLHGVIDARGAQVDVRMPDTLCVMAGDSDVRLILQNLVSNAVKFGDAGAPRVLVAAEEGADGFTSITVEDNGQGIAPEDRDRIFAAFERAAASIGHVGYGLGLAISQRLVERHGGHIRVETEPGRTRFVFTLPTASGERAEPVSAPSGSPA